MDQHIDLRIRHQLAGSNDFVVDHFDLLYAYFLLEGLSVGLGRVRALANRRWARNFELLLSGWVLHLHPSLSEVRRGETGHADESGHYGRWCLGDGWILAEPAEYVIKLCLQVWLCRGLSWRRAAHDIEEVVGGGRPCVEEITSRGRCVLRASGL